MKNVVFLTGSTVGGVFEALAKAFSSAFENAGFSSVMVNLGQADGMARLQEALTDKDTYFAMGFVGILGGLEVEPSENVKKNFWELGEVPYIGLHGDYPAYYFDRHINGTTGSAMLYGFREHYDFRRRMPHQRGMFAVATPFLMDTEPVENIDFKMKENGKLFFLKNGNDPRGLQALWKAKLPLSISSALRELGDLLAKRMHHEVAPDIDAAVLGYFLAKNMDVMELHKLRLFFVAQLDDYLRRVKSTFMAKVLSRFPVEIHGVNWEHIDFSDAACNFVSKTDYAVSRNNMKNGLGVIDMSPNTSSAFHDRPLRSFGMHTLCVTNEQDCITQTFGDVPVTFRFEKESLEARIDEVLSHPKRYVELGREMAVTFSKKHPAEEFVQHMIEIADALRLASVNHFIAGMQEFVVWPPNSIK